MQKIILNVTERLIGEFDSEQLKKIKNVITIVLFDYDFTKKETEIVEYQGGIPQEIQKYLVVKYSEGLSKKSIAGYKTHLVNFADTIGKDLKQATTDDIRVYLIKYQQERGVSNSSLNDKRVILSGFYKWMVEEDIITKSPMTKIKRIKADKKVREALSHLELEQIRASKLTIRQRAILETLYSTGCRVEELTRLNRSDLDFTTNRIKLYGKGKKERYSFLNAKAQIALRKYLLTRMDSEDALFIATKKPYNRLSKKSIEVEVGKMGEKANLKQHIFPHLIRHTTATHMLQGGASLSEVQMLLGHDSPATTQIYAKMDIDSLYMSHRRAIV